MELTVQVTLGGYSRSQVHGNNNYELGIDADSFFFIISIPIFFDVYIFIYFFVSLITLPVPQMLPLVANKVAAFCTSNPLINFSAIHIYQCIQCLFSY